MFFASGAAESHAASFALIAYASAYSKEKYLAAFKELDLPKLNFQVIRRTIATLA